jgi:hypothetical protein
MSENEKIKWRLSTESDQRDISSSLHQQKSRKKAEITRKSIQTKAEDIGSVRDGSLVTKKEDL